ncbi:kinesin-related protein 4-like [Hylaeus volcanicus]|uniref:kinesin-related protein 4-like n=1 Tax=Hylaeus volcanicus TaxID=313075 RepID=UPI0023B82593|nr:kinesin-related protein 4-like [Hylaeus volcanicus]
MYLFEKELLKEPHYQPWKNFSERKNLKSWGTNHSQFDNITIPSRSVLQESPSKHCKIEKFQTSNANTFSLNPLQTKLNMFDESDQSLIALKYKSAPLRHTFNGLRSPRFGKEEEETGVNECETFTNVKDDRNMRNSDVLLPNTQGPMNQRSIAYSSISARLSALQSQTLSGNNVETFELPHQPFSNHSWDTAPNNGLVEENNVLHAPYSTRCTMSNSSLPFHHMSSADWSLRQKQQDTNHSMTHLKSIAQGNQGSRTQIKSIVDKVPNLDLTSRKVGPFSFQNWGHSTNLKTCTTVKMTLSQSEASHSKAQKVFEKNSVENLRRYNKTENNGFSDSLSISNPLLNELQELKAMMSSIVTERDSGALKSTNMMTDNCCNSQDDCVESQASVSNHVELLNTENNSLSTRDSSKDKKMSPRCLVTAPCLPKKAPASPPSRKTILTPRNENLNFFEPISKNYSGVFDSAYMKDAQKFLEDEYEDTKRFNRKIPTSTKENDKNKGRKKSPRFELSQQQCYDTKETQSNQPCFEEGPEEREFEETKAAVNVQKKNKKPQKREIEVKCLEQEGAEEVEKESEESHEEKGEEEDSQEGETFDNESEDEETVGEEGEDAESVCEESEDEESDDAERKKEEDGVELNEETFESDDETSESDERTYQLDEECCERDEGFCESDEETSAMDGESCDSKSLSLNYGLNRDTSSIKDLNDKKTKKNQMKSQKSKKKDILCFSAQKVNKNDRRKKNTLCIDSTCERVKCHGKSKKTGECLNLVWSPRDVSHSTKDKKRCEDKYSDAVEKCNTQNRPCRHAKCVEHDLQKELALNNKLLLECLKKSSQGHENEQRSILSKYIQMRNVNGIDIPVLLVDACKMGKDNRKNDVKDNNISEEQFVPITVKESTEKAFSLESKTQGQNLILLLEKKNDELCFDILKIKEERHLLESQTQILKNEKEVLENDCQVLKERVTELEKQIKLVQAEMESYKVQVEITKNDCVETRETLSMDVAKIRESRDELQNLLCVQENHMKAAHAGLDKLQEERQRLLRELTALERLDTDKSSIIDKLNAEVLTCKEECEKLHSQVQQTESLISKLKDENKKLSQRNSIYEQEKETIEEEKQTLLKKLSKGMSFEEKEELLDLVQLHQQKYEKTQEEIQRLKKEVEASVSTRVQFEKELLETTEEMESALQVAKEKIRNAETEKLQALAREKALLAEKESFVKINKSQLSTEKEELEDQMYALQRELEEAKNARRDAELKTELLKKKTQEIQDDQMSVEKLWRDNEEMKLKIVGLSKSKKILEQDLKSTLHASRGLHQKLMQLQSSNLIVDAEEGKRLRQCEKEWENYQLAAKRRKSRIKRYSVLSLQFSPLNSLILNKGVQVGPPFSLSASLYSETRCTASADKKNHREPVKNINLSPTSPSSSSYSRSLSNSSQSSTRSYTGGALKNNVTSQTQKRIERKTFIESSQSSILSKPNENRVPQFQKPTQSFVMRRQQSLMKHARVDDICVRGLHRVEPCTNVFRRNRRIKYDDSLKSLCSSPKTSHTPLHKNEANCFKFEDINSTIEPEDSNVMNCTAATGKQNNRSNNIPFKEGMENVFNTLDEEKSCESFFLSENKTLQNTQHCMKEKNWGVASSVKGVPQRITTHPLDVSVEQQNNAYASFPGKNLENCTPFHLKNCDFQKVTAPTIETPDFGSHSAFQCSTTFLDVSTKKSNVDSLRQKLLNEGILSTENLV